MHSADEYVVPGAGLSIEQRKRVTLGVELVAKPTLLFLDEPTSGLDGQSAYNIIRFLRKLVDSGQAVLVSTSPCILACIYSYQTVHHPPAFCCAFRRFRLTSSSGQGRQNGLLRREYVFSSKAQSTKLTRI